MLTSFIKHYGMVGILFCASLAQLWNTQAEAYPGQPEPGESLSYQLTIEGDIIARCNLSQQDSSGVVDMGTMVMRSFFETKYMTTWPIALSGDCLNTTGAWISVDGIAIDRGESSLFLNNLSPAEGVAAGVGTWVGMDMRYSNGDTREIPRIKVGEKYMLQPTQQAALNLYFNAQLEYLEGFDNATATPGSFSSVITIRLMVP